MMNLEILSTNTEQKPIHLFQDTSTVHVTDIQADRIIKKARAILALQKKTNPRAMNLIQMAETALKNGNPVSANDFAAKVLMMLSYENLGKVLKENVRPPEQGITKPVKNTGNKRKHTEHTYLDSSNDPGVSFSYPGKLTGPESFLAVPAHEYEHARHSLREAILSGERVMVVVSYRVRYDPATGEPYMAGGVTRTIKFPDIPLPDKGKNVDILV